MSAIVSQYHWRLDCLLSRLFRGRSKKTSKLRVTGLCEGNPLVTGGFLSQRASNAENVSIWWRHNVAESSSPRDNAPCQSGTQINSYWHLDYSIISVIGWFNYVRLLLGREEIVACNTRLEYLETFYDVVLVAKLKVSTSPNVSWHGDRFSITGVQ